MDNAAFSPARALGIASAVLSIAAGTSARAADAAHPGRLVFDRAGAVVVAAGTANGQAASIVRIDPAGGLRVIHRFPLNDVPASLALIGDRVVGINGLPEGGGGAFTVTGTRFRRVFRVPDDGYGTIAYVRGVPASTGFTFAMDGGRGASCRGFKRQTPCGAIEAIGPNGARRIATFGRPTAPYALAGNGRSAWFGAFEPPRVLDLGGRYSPIYTLDPAVDAAPFFGGALLALRGHGQIVVTPIDVTRVIGVAHIAAPDASDVTLRTRAHTAYLLVTTNGHSGRSKTTLYLFSPTGDTRAVGTWSTDNVQLHYVDAGGDAVVSTEQRTVAGEVTSRGALFRITANGALHRLPLGPWGERGAVDDAIEGPGGAVWSLVSFFGSPLAVVRSDPRSARSYPIPAGSGKFLRKN
ncbi:MAG: hypothetical protein M3169_12520 [Candidatus Eremiobacteraeota bacterium]|nr:hypothetical protein [Candidatus Eremiobacteraeota bacterium]